jgi:hypothetical protein
MGLPRFIAIHDPTQRLSAVWTRQSPAATWELQSLPFRWESLDRVFRVGVTDGDASGAVSASSMTPLYSSQRAGVQIVSDCPAVAAAAAGKTELNGEALLLEHIFGFVPNEQSMFRGVHRCCAGRQGDDAKSGHGEARTDLLNVVEQACTAGLWLELTGGFDSQMVLALALTTGVKPPAAFTIGEPGNFDVVEASRVSQLLGIRHIRVPMSSNEPRISEEIRRSLIDSRYGLNPIEIAHIYASLDVIDDDRQGQISGVGGEACGHFYSLGLPHMIDRRMQGLTRAYAAKHLSEAVRCFGSVACRAAMRDFRRWWSSERMDGDAFYVKGRLANWAAPVLVASSERYQSVNPLMTDAYRAWISAMPGGGRERQRHALREMCKEHPEINSFTPLQAARSTLSQIRSSTRRLAAASGLRSRRLSPEWVRNAHIAIQEYGSETIRAIALELGCLTSRADDIASGKPYAARLIGLLVKCHEARLQASRERVMLPEQVVAHLGQA